MSLPIFTKPLGDISIEDIRSLITEQYPEDDRVEYKQAIPTQKGDEKPKAGTIGSTGKKKLLKEIVAFANSYGGHLLIGIKESEDKPPTASEITPIEKCVEVAENLRLAIRDRVEPKIPVIQIVGIPTENDGSGIVIIRVARSRLAPHRSKDDLECYYRRNDRSEKMSMREIQDLTLQRYSEDEKIEARFAEQHTEFQRKFNPENTTIRATLIPVSDSLWVDRIHKHPQLKVLYEEFPIHLGNQRKTAHFYVSLPVTNHSPILRGTRYTLKGHDVICYIEIYCNGTVNYSFSYPTISHEMKIYPSWIMSTAIHAILTAHQFRLLASTPSTEYGMELEIWQGNRVLQFGSWFKNSFTEKWSFEGSHLKLPRLSVGTYDEFPELIKILHRDMWDSVGCDQFHDFRVELPEENSLLS